MTAQVHERLILDGQESSMAFCPPLPKEHPRIFKTSPDEVASDAGSYIFGSTACWRGYQGTWEIKDGQFYLVGLRGRYRMSEGDPILADWFTGVLRVLKGRLIRYVHMGFGSVHQGEVHIKIENGVVLDSRVIDNLGKKHNEKELGWKNLPGSENRFPGDDEL